MIGHKTRVMWRLSCLPPSLPCLLVRSISAFFHQSFARLPITSLPHPVCYPSHLLSFLSFPFISLSFGCTSPLFLLRLPFPFHTLASFSVVSPTRHSSRSFLSVLPKHYLTPATLHWANSSGTTKNAYMSCTKLLCCQLTAVAVDRQQQENKTPLILPHA